MSETDAMLKKGVLFQYATLAWAVAQAVAAAVAGFYAGSIALISLGLVTLVSAARPAMLLRRLKLESSGKKGGDDLINAEHRMLFAVGIVFFLLGMYVLNEASSRLYYREKPDVSFAGILISVFSCIMLSVLAVIKFRIAKALENGPLRSDAFETAMAISWSVLAGMGLGLYGRMGWWWADPMAALLMLPLIFRRGWSAIEDSKGTMYDSDKVRLGP